MKLRRHHLVVLLVSNVALTASVSTAAAARTWTVCASGCDYTTIPAALNAASNGDTVSVRAGTYSGGFTITKSIRLVGAGASTTLIRGGSPVVRVGDPPILGQSDFISVLISGVTIRDGIANPPGPDGFPWNAGGVQNNARLTLSASVVAGNSGDLAAGVVNRVSLELNGSTIRENRATGEDFNSAAGFYNVGIAVMNNSTISQNVGGIACGGIFSNETFGYDFVGLSLSNSRVVGNEPGGICLEAGKFVLRDSTVSENHGIGIWSFVVDATVYNRLVVSNNSGGGIRNEVFADLVFSNVSIENSQIIGNKSVGVAAVGNGANAFIAITNSIIARNTAQRCAGIDGTDGILSIIRSTITGNAAVDDGGGVCGVPTISNSTISRNQAGGYGGGLWGGGTITGSRFERNTAGIDGGGIWNLFGVHLQGTTFSNNIPNDCVNAPSSPPTGRC